jgi:hypothetical protein
MISPVFGQIDYNSKQLATISAVKPNVNVRWIDSSPCKCPLYFDHAVAFINTKDDQIIGSDVILKIYHNNTLIKKLNFKTGEGIVSSIELSDPIRLKRNDSVYFKLTLIPNNPDEEYVFNIFPKRMKTAPPSNLIVSNKPVEKKTPVKREIVTTNMELKRMRRNRTIVSIAKIVLH